MKFKGDIIITDPCYIIKNIDDWVKSNFGKNMKALGLKTYISRDIGDDWSCICLEEKSGNKLGEFCADMGMVAIMQLDEVLKYNPKFDYHEINPRTTLIKDLDGEIDIKTVLIKDFDGEIDIKTVCGVYEDENGEKDDVETFQIIGKGNINFVTWDVDVLTAVNDNRFVIENDESFTDAIKSIPTDNISAEL